MRLRESGGEGRGGGEGGGSRDYGGREGGKYFVREGKSRRERKE